MPVPNTAPPADQIHACGGTILGGPDYRQCNRCGAFDVEDGDFPTGTDPQANRQAWDDGEGRSPDAA
jgi:hypothetical protein